MSSQISAHYHSQEKQRMDFQELCLELPLFYPELKIDFVLILGTWINTEQNSKIVFKMGQKEKM
jgi:arginine exporter protein ArgO